VTDAPSASHNALLEFAACACEVIERSEKPHPGQTYTTVGDFLRNLCSRRWAAWLRVCRWSGSWV